MQHVLRAISGPHAGAVYVLGGRTTIGRASDCEIQILHEGVSRHHAKLTLEDDGSLVVTDLSSDNGTFVEDERVERHVLAAGVVLRIMRSRFTYEQLPAGDAETSAVFRRKVTSGDSLRQTVHHDKASTATRTGLSPGSPGGTMGERGRPYSRPQAAAPAPSGARPGAATTAGRLGDEDGSASPEPAPELVDEAPRVRRVAPPQHPAAAARLVEPSVAARGRYGTAGPGRRERVTLVPTSGAPSSASSARVERAIAPPPPSGPSGRMSSLAPPTAEPDPHRVSAPSGLGGSGHSSASASGWVRVARPLDTPGSMRPGSTLSGMQRMGTDASPPASPRPVVPSSALPPARGPRSSTTAEYGAVGARQITEAAPVMREAPVPAPEAAPEADLDAMATVPSVRRAKRQGSSTPTEEVPRVRDAAAADEVADDDSQTKTQPRVTLVPSGLGPAVPAVPVAPTAATPTTAPTAPVPALQPSRSLILTAATRDRARAIGYEDTLRFQRADPLETGRPPPPRPPDVPQARPHATSAEIITALEALLPPAEAAPVEASDESRPDAQTHEVGLGAGTNVDALLDAAADDEAWPAVIGELSEVDRIELRAQQVLEQADRDHKRRDGLERLVDILEYRELRLRALHGQLADPGADERCAVLEQVLQQQAPAGDDMAAMRRYHRFVCSIPAQLTHRPRGVASTATVELEDLSAGGAKITFGEYSLGAGETVWLAIDLAQANRSRIPYPEATSVVMKARVVWSQPQKASLGLIFAGSPRYDMGGSEA